MKRHERVEARRQKAARLGLCALLVCISALFVYERQLRRVPAEDHPSAEALVEADGDGQLENDPNSETAINAVLGSVESLPVATHFGEWVNRGPKNFSGKVFSLAVHPTDENIVFAAYGGQSDSHSSNGTGAGLWRTTNGGVSWEPVIPAEEDPCVLSVDIHPYRPNFVVAGLRGNAVNRHPGDVRLSRDGGNTWESIGPVSSDNPPLNAFAVKFDIRNPDIVYVGTHKGLFQTTNAGKEWVKVLAYSGTGFFPDAPSLAMHPADPNTLLLAVQSRGDDGERLGVQRTSDGGKSWTKVDSDWDGQGEPITVLAWSLSSSNVVYAERILVHSRSMATYRSTDAGRTWAATTLIDDHNHQNRYDMSIAVDPGDENHVVVANVEMYYSTDGLLTPPQVILPPRFPGPPHPHVDHLAIAFAPSNPNVVYNGNDGGVWKSLDGGRSWHRADRGVRANHVSSFAVYPDTGVINLSAADNGAIAYDPNDPQEGGWHASNCGFEYRANRAKDTAHAYYGGGGTTKLTRIGDAFRNCQVIENTQMQAEARESHIPMGFDPIEGDTIYTGLGHLWKSTDNGVSWESKGIEPIVAAGGHIRTFEVAPSDGQTLYALGNQNANLWASRDGGGSWALVNGTAFTSPRALVVRPADANTLFVGTDMGTDARHGLFRSDNGGQDFARITAFPTNLPINKIIIDPGDMARMFVATGLGVLITEDGGESWARLGEVLRGIVVDESLIGATLWASSDQGLWAMELTGRVGCEQPVTVLPTQVTLGSSGGRARIDISSAFGCSWTAASSSDWARLETFGQSRGPALIDVILEPNAGENRQAILTVAGQRIPLKQFGGADPIVPGGFITIANAGDCLTSVSTSTVQLAPCDGSGAQLFRLQRFRPLLYRIVTASPSDNDCLDTGTDRRAGQALKRGGCAGEGEAHQLFELQQDDSGWRLRGNLSGRTVGPEGHTLLCQERNGNQLQQQLCSDSAAQRFQIDTAALSAGEPKVMRRATRPD